MEPRPVRTTLVVLALLIVPFTTVAEETPVSPAPSPEELAQDYFELLKAEDWKAAAELFDPVSLAEFREMMAWLDEPELQPGGGELLKSFFGPGADAEAVAGLSNQEYFGGMMRGLMAQVASLGGLDFDKIEVLGSVPEGEDVVHTVTRNFVSVGEIDAEGMEVISFKRTSGGWKILLSGKLKGIPAQLKQAVAAQGG